MKVRFLKFKRDAHFPGKALILIRISAVLESLDRPADNTHCRGFFSPAPQHAYRYVGQWERSSVLEVVYVECWVGVPPTEVSLIAGQSQAGRECKMAHSCRWRFPARPGGSSNSGTGRRAGRIRVTASLRSVLGAHPNAAGLGRGFDAALQVSSVIESNLQKFRDVLGESSDSSSGEVSTRRDKSSQMVPRDRLWQLRSTASLGEPLDTRSLRFLGSNDYLFLLAASSVERANLSFF